MLQVLCISEGLQAKLINSTKLTLLLISFQILHETKRAKIQGDRHLVKAVYNVIFMKVKSISNLR